VIGVKESVYRGSKVEGRGNGILEDGHCAFCIIWQHWTNKILFKPRMKVPSYVQ